MPPLAVPDSVVRALPRSLVHRALRRLPLNRRAAARALVRHAGALITGATPTTAGPAPTPARPAGLAGRKSGLEVRGRWLRGVPGTTDGEPPVEREVTDPTEAAATRAGWLLVDAHERLSTAGAQRVFGHEIDAWYAYADASLSNLVHPEGAEWVDVHESRNNRLRYRRTMDFARRGDRVFDVGFGRGYLASLLIRDAGVEAYHGIDVVQKHLPLTQAMLEANDLADAAVQLELGDLFDLTPERLTAMGATLVICCEVLEHVDDAERALRVLADALPEGADLLFSVPLHGRLEAVWGHLSVFDVARLKQMLDGAGLHAHHVEPLSNTWTLVVASRDAGPSTRVREATARPPLRVSQPLSAHRDFVDVPSQQMSAVPSGGGVAPDVTVRGDHHVTCRLSANGGVSFPVKGLESLRLMFDFTDAQHVKRYVVSAYAGTDLVGSWTSKQRAGQAPGRRARFVMRPGESSTGFVSGPHGDTGTADRVEVVVEVAKGRLAEFDLRAAYLP